MKKTLFIGSELLLSCLLFAQIKENYYVTSGAPNLSSEPTTSSNIVEKLNPCNNVIILKSQ